MKPLELAGQKFGELTAIRKHDKKSMWICKCSCGNEKLAVASRLKKGITTSCGCKTREKQSKSMTRHGMKGTPIYSTWNSMKNRCLNPKSKYSKHYIEKGIRVCDEWLNFEGFYKDMGDSHFEGAFIDRIDNSEGYCKENCRWVTVLESNRNKTSVLTIEEVREIRASDLTRTELAKKYKVSYMTIKKILVGETWKEV